MVKEDLDVLRRIEHVIERFMWITPEERLGISLWILHTYVHKNYLYTPRLALLSPWYGHGKSTMLDIIEKLAFNSYKTVSATPAVIFRVMGNSPISVTMLLDEGDNQNLRLNADYRKILNANRRGDKVDRVSGKQVIKYDVFSPIAIAAVHDLYPALMQRSLIVYILQPPPEAKLEVLPQKPNPTFTHEMAELQNDIELWAQTVELAENPPNPLKIRYADNWRVFLAIADSFNRNDDARKALAELVKGYPQDNPGANLLSDIWDLFDEYQSDRCFTKKMIEYLHRQGWDNWTGLDGELRPHSLSERELASILRRFKIYPTVIRPLGPRATRGHGARGYFRKDFEYAWSVYCPDRPKHVQIQEVTEPATVTVLKPKLKKKRFKITPA